jgi:hypothetical protein
MSLCVHVSRMPRCTVFTDDNKCMWWQEKGSIDSQHDHGGAAREQHEGGPRLAPGRRACIPAHQLSRAHVTSSGLQGYLLLAGITQLDDLLQTSPPSYKSWFITHHSRCRGL